VGTYFTLGPDPCSLQIMKRRRSHILVFAALLIMGAGQAPTPALAQTQEPASGRTLAGHRFLPSSTIDDPFITQHIRTLTGGAIAKSVETGVGESVGDSIIALLSGDLAFLALGFEYQHGFTDWLAVSGGFTGGARLGTGAESILAQGVTSIFSFEVQAKARFLQREKWLLSAILRMQPTTQYGLDPIGWVKQVIEDGGLSEENSLLASSTTYGGAIGVRGAYAPRPWIGFQGLLDLGFANAFSDDGRSTLKTAFGGLVSFDLNPSKGIPLGFTASFKTDEFVEANSDITDKTHATGLGVLYTGREDFSIGLETTFLNIPRLSSDGAVNASSFAFNLRYYF